MCAQRLAHEGERDSNLYAQDNISAIAKVRLSLLELEGKHGAEG